MNMHIKLRLGAGESTKVGFKNKQECHGTFGVKGNEYGQYACRLECLHCGFVYGANGSDIASPLPSVPRRCTRHLLLAAETVVKSVPIAEERVALVIIDIPPEIFTSPIRTVLNT
jgi:hypothetical protein